MFAEWDNILLAGFASTSIFSTFLYLLLPGGTAEFFGDKNTEDVRHWVTIVAAGDVLLAYLCIEALRLKDKQIKALVFRAAAIYLTFHMGAFFCNYINRDPYGAPGYLICIIVAVTAAWKWGFNFNISSQNHININNSSELVGTTAEFEPVLTPI